jgi:hypothetical protein
MSSPVSFIAADLNESAQVVLDGSGNGIAKLSPHGTRYSGYSWLPVNLYVTVATNVKEAQATAYVSYGILSSTPTDAIGQTATGSTGDTCGMTQTVKPGDWISVRWTGGDAGQVATMRVTGKANIPVYYGSPS